MRRFSSIDFMRGLAIWMMVIFHVIMRWYDDRWVSDGEFEGVPLAGLVFFLFIVYFSAWAGFFLMVSAVGNMISMYRNLDRGKTWKKIIMFQVIGGTMLLIAAIVVESTIGYHAFFGYLVEGKADRWTTILYRGYHMETIHTIALCVIVNGIVQGILSRNGGHRKVKRNVKVYAALAAISIALTGPIYKVLRIIAPGYPNARWTSSIVGNLDVQYPVIGESGIGDIFLKGIMAILGGNPEPLFPFLAISFIGSIIGIYLCQRDCPKKLPRNGILIGLAIAIVGLIGTITVIGTGVADVDQLTDNFYQIPNLYPGLWLWWFLFLMGGHLVAVMFVLRMVEFRGRGKEFGKRTTTWRRYGYVAFSIYTFQFIDAIPRAMMGVFPDIHRQWPYPEDIGWWFPVIVMIPMTLLLWEVVLRSWEKIEYAGGMEWCLAKIAEKLLPGRREKKRERKRWWQASRLNAKEYLYRPQWLNIVEEKQIDHEHLEESKLSLIVSITAIFFFPFTFIALSIRKASLKYEGRNTFNRAALVISLINLVLYTCLIIALFFVKAPSI